MSVVDVQVSCLGSEAIANSSKVEDSSRRFARLTAWLQGGGGR